MRINKVKQKLKNGRPTIGTWLTLGNLHAARFLARAGYEWLTLDVEHAPYDWREIASVVAAIADAGCVPLIRVPDGSHSWIKRALDAGAYGIVVPMVETVEQARAAIAAAKYPPLGNRSSGGGMHNLNFDCSAEEYYLNANDQILVVLQTESPLGVENAEEIYALPGCDAIFVGPNDLRFQMRDPDGTFPTPTAHEAMIQRVIAIGRGIGCPTGMHVMDVAQADLRVNEGMQFVAVSSDMGMLSTQAMAVAEQLGLNTRPDLARY
ncbi:MAG: aldolase/citrate lyase family protein [Pirellulaceae bacterium]